MSKRKRPSCERCGSEMWYSYSAPEYKAPEKDLCGPCRDKNLVRAIEIRLPDTTAPSLPGSQ